MSGKPSPTHREIAVDDAFGRQARSPGGPSREVSLKRAAAELSRIKPRLEDYLRAEAGRLETALLAAQARDANYLDHIRNAYAASRNIRDVAASIGYSLAGFVTMTLCIVIETAEAAEIECPTDIIACHYEAFRLATSTAYLTMNPDDVPELSGGLLQIVRIAKAAAIDPPSPVDPTEDRS